MDSPVLLLYGDSLLRFVSENKLVLKTKNNFVRGAQLNDETGSRVVNLLKRYPTVKIVILHIGTNNVYNKELELILDDNFYSVYRSCIKEILNFKPQIKLFISSVIPRKGPDSESVLIVLNKKLRKLASEHTQTEFIPSYMPFLKGGGRIKKFYTHDGLHLNDEGVNALINTFNKSLQFVSKKQKK